MDRDERTGLAVLLIFLVVSGLLCAFTTGGGRSIGNIFSNLISNPDYPPSPAVESQLDPLKQPIGGYWLIGSITAVVGLVTLCGIGIYLVIRRRVPRSWCLFLIGVGAVEGSLLVLATRVQSELAAIPMPKPPVSSSTYEGLAAAVNLLTQVGAFGGVLVLIGVVLLGWSLIQRGPSGSESS